MQDAAHQDKEEPQMGNPVVHFEAIGRDAQVWGRSSPLIKSP